MLIIIGIHRIGKGSPAAVIEICSKQGGLIDEIETYDFKLKTHIGKLDVRVQFTDTGEPQVVAIKKTEYKRAIFDVLCLNRYVHYLCSLRNEYKSLNITGNVI